MTSWLLDFAHHRHNLLEEQRIPGGRGADPCPELGVEAAVCRQQLVDQCLGLTGVERFEENRRGVEFAAAPARAAIEQLRPAETEHQYRDATAQVADVLDQVEQCRLAPVNVVEDDDDRLLFRRGLE